MIRQGKLTDLPELMILYDQARTYMARTGNPHQWPPEYPGAVRLTEDIENQQLYVVERDGALCGAFVLQLGDEFGYADIRGKWLRDVPYGTIHRLAGREQTKGIFEECLDFCCSHAPDIRADTHRDNRVMRHLLEKHGFVPCGEITLEDGGERIAYQLREIRGGSMC